MVLRKAGPRGLRSLCVVAEDFLPNEPCEDSADDGCDYEDPGIRTDTGEHEPPAHLRTRAEHPEEELINLFETLMAPFGAFLPFTVRII